MTIDIAGNTVEEEGEEGADDGGQDRQSNQQHDCCADEECCHDVEDDGDGVCGDDVVHMLLTKKGRDWPRAASARASTGRDRAGWSGSDGDGR